MISFYFTQNRKGGSDDGPTSSTFFISASIILKFISLFVSKRKYFGELRYCPFFIVQICLLITASPYADSSTPFFLQTKPVEHSSSRNQNKAKEKNKRKVSLPTSD